MNLPVVEALPPSEHREWYLEQLSKFHRTSINFHNDWIVNDWVNFDFKAKYLPSQTEHSLVVHNLYSFALLCGETLKPWEWLDNSEIKGALGLYIERHTCYVLRRRHNTQINIAKFIKQNNE